MYHESNIYDESNLFRHKKIVYNCFNSHFTSVHLYCSSLVKFQAPQNFKGFKSLATIKQILHRMGGGAPDL